MLLVRKARLANLGINARITMEIPPFKYAFVGLIALLVLFALHVLIRRQAPVFLLLDLNLFTKL